MLVSIIIPAYNEEATVKSLIEEIRKSEIQPEIELEIIVVNDGSTDNTAEIIESIDNVFLLNQSNQGKGKAVQNGIKKSSGDFILIQDADLEYSPHDYKSLFEPILSNEAGISVYGRRKKSINDLSPKIISWIKKHPDQPLTSWVANIFLSILVFILYGRFISDTLTGYKVYPKSFFDNNVINANGFEADHEITVKLFENNFEIIEVPVDFFPRTAEEGKKIGIRDFFVAIYVFVKFSFNNEIIRFIFGGGTTFLIDLTIYSILTRLIGLDYFTSRSISIICAILYNFILYKNFVFQSDAGWALEKIKYLIVVSITAFTNLSIMFLLVTTLGIHDLFALLVGTISVVILNFLGHKFWTFKK